MKNWIEYMRLESRLDSYPPQIVIELTNICNLRCPLCPTGLGITDRKKGKMPIQLYRGILQQLTNRTQVIHLYNWGEPLLLKDFAEYCRLGKQLGFVVSTSTNLNMAIDDDKAAEIVNSGLDRLIVSLDGLSEATYVSYRRGGDFGLVMQNLRTIIAVKKRLRKRYPLLILQLVRHKKNASDAGVLGQACRKIGADDFGIVDVLMPFGKGADSELMKEWVTENRLFRDYMAFDIGKSELGKACFHLWKLPVINYDGSIAPCCYVYQQKDDFGSIAGNSFKAVWNSPIYRDARKLFKMHDFSYLHPCCRCSVYRIQQLPRSEPKINPGIKSITRN